MCLGWEVGGFHNKMFTDKTCTDKTLNDKRLTIKRSHIIFFNKTESSLLIERTVIVRNLYKVLQ